MTVSSLLSTPGPYLPAALWFPTITMPQPHRNVNMRHWDAAAQKTTTNLFIG
jgi:hypothetical protein